MACEYDDLEMKLPKRRQAAALHTLRDTLALYFTK
jgi:hypothetical protein